MTDSHSDTLSWYPIPGMVALPYDYENDRKLAYDFTFYSQEGNDGFGSDIGWTCPSGSQLTQETWAWQGHTDKPALATLELHANSSQEDYWGAATFTWWYESDFVTPEEVYEGEWGLTANGEYSGVLMLDMTRTGGKRYIGRCPKHKGRRQDAPIFRNRASCLLDGKMLFQMAVYFATIGWQSTSKHGILIS